MDYFNVTEQIQGYLSARPAWAEHRRVLVEAIGGNDLSRRPVHKPVALVRKGQLKDTADPNEMPLAERIHKSVHEVDSLLKDFQLEIRKEKSVLRTVDLEIEDIGVFDYSTTPVWWGGSPGPVQTGLNMTTTLFPTPEGHFTNATRDPWDKLNLPGIHPNYSPSDVFELVPNHGHVPDHDYQLDQTPINLYLLYSPPDPVYTSLYDPSFVLPPDPFTVSTPATPSAPDHNFNHISLDTYSAGSQTYRLPTKALLPVPAFRGSPSILSGVTVSELYKKLMSDRTGYKTYGNRVTKTNRLTTLAHRPRKPGRTRSKAQAWVQNRQWLKSKKAGKTLLGHIRQGSDDPADNSPVENKTAEVENSPNEQTPDNAENSPNEKTPDNAENSPNEQTPDNDEKSPDEKIKGGNVITPETDAFASFSMPGLADIIPSLSIPGLDEVVLTTPLMLPPTTTTTLNPLEIETTMTETAFTAELFQEDGQGFLFVSSPGTIYSTSERPTNTLGLLLLHAENFTATTEGALVDSYHKLMETLDEGYLMVFFLEFSRLIAQKRPSDVGSVLGHVEGLYNELYEQGTLLFVGEEFLELGAKVCRMFSGSNIRLMQSKANMMNQMLKGRSEFLSVEVNSVIDYADMLFEDDEGEALFEVLHMFEAFPFEGMSGRELCSRLIETFIRPYRRLRDTERLRKLTDSITTIVAKKFPRRSHGAEIIPRGTKDRLQSREQKQLEPLPLRQKLEIKRHQKFYRSNQPDKLLKHRRQVYTTEAMMRSMLPITKFQKRFHIMTPRQLRSNAYLNLVRPTVGYLKRRVGKPVHPPNAMLQFFPQASNVKYTRRAQITSAEKHHPEESATQKAQGAMRDEVRRNVAESSYSDDEALLKMNLRQALRVNWHKTSTTRK